MTILHFALMTRKGLLNIVVLNYISTNTLYLILFKIITITIKLNLIKRFYELVAQVSHNLNPQ